ncbi:MAG TPA: hypothetical protein VIG99_20995 [Myxococcaceae bacterium]
MRAHALLAWACASAAGAGTLWSGHDITLEGRAFYKVLGTGVRLSPGLVLTAAELERILDEARVESGGAPNASGGLVLPGAGGSTGHVARLEGKATWKELLEVDLAYELDAVMASNPAFVGGPTLSTTLTGAEGGAPQRRLVDLPATLYSTPGLIVTENLDRFSVRLSTRHADVVIGRQVLSWGTGRFWNPTDLLSPFPPTQVDREVRRGIDAVRVTAPLSKTAQLEMLWLPRKVAAENGGALRVQGNLYGYDLSLSAAKYVDDLVLGADFSGDAGPAGLHGEAAYTWGLTGLGEPGAPVGVGERALRAVVGVDLKPTEKLALSAEYSFNGFGAADPSGYLAVLTSPRARRGEIFGAGRHYAGVAATYAFTELLNAQLLAIVNLQDPSAQLLPVLEYWFEQSVILRAVAFLPLGPAPDPSALRGLHGSAGVASPVFQQTLSTLGLRSEFGLASYGAALQVGIYFQ